MILRSIKTDYKFVRFAHHPKALQILPLGTITDISPQPLTYPDRISVYHKLRSPPTTTTDSVTLDVLILSERHQRPAARCVEDIVIYDYRAGKKAPLQPFMVGRFQETFHLQERSKARNEQRVKDLLQQVVKLEKESWDREGAVEDMGTAA